MVEFRKYQHVERFGTTEVEGIELGEVVIFPKLDGTNGSVWLGDDGKIRAGSRKRELSIDDDNAGFYAYISQHKGIRGLLKEHPHWRLYGEWLVPHSLKTYKDDAWRKFYVFDVLYDSPEDDDVEYIPFNYYQESLDIHGIDYIIPLCTMKNPSYENLVKALESNTFLVKDGKGTGEGIVIKRYDYVNRYGRTTWAKMVTNDFKVKHTKEQGIPEILTKQMVEQRIADIYCTEWLIEKEYQKIATEYDGWHSECIPELFGRVYYELIREECWKFVKELKNPTINFKTLHGLVIQKIKQVKPELF